MKLLLVAVDNSPRAPHVLATAIDMAKRCGAKIRLLRAVGIPPEVPMDVLGLSPDDFLQALVDNANHDLKKLIKDVPPELFEGTEARVGTPWSAICQAAHDDKADMIVIGSHGYAGLDKLLGTTAAKVTNHADCSVLVVRPERS